MSSIVCWPAGDRTMWISIGVPSGGGRIQYTRPGLPGLSTRGRYRPAPAAAAGNRRQASPRRGFDCSLSPHHITLDQGKPWYDVYTIEATSEAAMARSVGMRELRARASAILRRVREKHEAVDVTYRGQVIARIVPVSPRLKQDRTLSAVWTDLDQLAGEIGRYWRPKGKSAAKVVSEGRRG